MNISIKFIMYSQVLCGFYFYNSFSRPVALLIKLYCIVVCALCVINCAEFYFTTFKTKSSHNIYLFVFFLEYILNFLFSFVTGGGFYRFYNSLKKIPSISDPCTSKVPVTMIYTFFIFVTKPINLLGYCLNSSLPMVVCLPGVIKHTCAVSTLSVCLVFELMWYQMKSFRKNMESILSVSGFSVSLEDSKKAIKHSLIVYRSLINTMNEVSSLKFPVFLAHICLILKLLIIFDAIVSKNVLWLPIITIFLEVFNLLLWSGLAACVNSEIDKVKLMIKKKLFYCSDKCLQELLEDALMYLTLRPFKFSVFRIFTVGADLFLSILSLVTTFIIILVQFSHVFD